MEPVPETEAVFEELAAHGDTEVATILDDMGRRTLEIVPDCVGLSLMMVADGLTYTLVASDERFASLDAVQYFDEGPANAVLGTQQPVVVNTEALMDEGRWLTFARATSETGIASTLSMPLVRNGHVIGAVNLYASATNAFNGHHGKLADALRVRRECDHQRRSHLQHPRGGGEGSPRTVRPVRHRRCSKHHRGGKGCGHHDREGAARAGRSTCRNHRSTSRARPEEHLRVMTRSIEK